MVLIKTFKTRYAGPVGIVKTLLLKFRRVEYKKKQNLKKKLLLFGDENCLNSILRTVTFNSIHAHVGHFAKNVLNILFLISSKMNNILKRSPQKRFVFNLPNKSTSPQYSLVVRPKGVSISTEIVFILLILGIKKKNEFNETNPLSGKALF